MLATALRTSCLLVLVVASVFGAQASVKSPEQHLGHPLAADHRLPDWDAVRGYFEALDAASPRVVTEQVGVSTEGRAFVLSTISSEGNLARLDEWRAIARLLSDPRGADEAALSRAVADGKPILFISCNMHSTECASPQFAMQFAFELATSDEEPWKSAREELVVVLAPSINPDGMDEVAKWYMRHVGTPYEATELPRLYQKYAGHDNNRDWFALSLAETRIVTEQLYQRWRPTVYWDVHQQGSKKERLFVPPFRDPLNPNLDPGVIAGINVVGTRAVWDLTREGLTGVATGGTYDMWWNGGNRNVPVRHNIIGLLTEAASCKLATPIFQQRAELVEPDGVEGYRPSNSFVAPWPGGWWRLRDIVDYELAFGRSLLRTLSREREAFLANSLEAARRSLELGRDEAPRGWVVPPLRADGAAQDRGATRRLVDALLQSAIEVEVAQESFEADGRAHPAGSIVLRREQPYGRHLKDLFEIQRYPGTKAPYDVAGWTLPLLFGVERVEVSRPFAARTRLVAEAADAVSAFDAKAGWTRDSDALRERAKALPTVGLHSPWSGDMDEGWMRWFLEHFGIRHAPARNEHLRGGALAFTTLILPGVGSAELDRGRAEGSAPSELVGGLDPEGAARIEEFVRGGGHLVAVGGSARWAIDALELGVVDLSRGDAAKDFACPGSVLRCVPEAPDKQGGELLQGLPDAVSVFFSRSSAFKLDKDKLEARGQEARVMLRYAPTQLLQSGWIKGGELIEGQAAWVRVRHGDGIVDLFGFAPQYRSWSQQAFTLMVRALLDRSMR